MLGRGRGSRSGDRAWTVTAVLGHIAFWDAKVLVLADKLERGVPFSPSDAEPGDVVWINGPHGPLIHAIPAAGGRSAGVPRLLSQLAGFHRGTDDRIIRRI